MKELGIQFGPKELTFTAWMITKDDKDKYSTKMAHIKISKPQILRDDKILIDEEELKA